MRRAWLSAAMLLAGTSLLVSAGHASQDTPTKLRQGGTLRVNLPQTDIDDIDPSLAYGTVSWQIEYSTALRLVNYPDAPAPRGSRLVPEGASSFRVSRDGKAYTFTIRKGFRFSDGRPVTARNYAYAINRTMHKALKSPAARFLDDPNGPSGVTVRVMGNRLIVELGRPDGAFLAKMAMPFFQAIPLSLPRGEKVIAVDRDLPLPSAGPYYVSFREPHERVTLKRNPFYGGSRPRRLLRIDITPETDLDSSYEKVRGNQVDYALSLPREAPAQLGMEFGLKGRFRVRPRNCISFIAMNSNNRLFRGNPRLRRAVNYVIDRMAMVELSGTYTALPADQYLPAGSPGFKNIDAYPFTPNVAKARKLANGRVRNGGPWKYYYGLAAPGPQRMELVRSYLAQIGITIDPQGFRGFAIYDAAGKRNSPHAFVTAGWCQHIPDPYDFINVLLYGGSIQNTNIAHFNSRRYDRRMSRAAKLVGPARLRAYQRLEHDLVTKAAPLAVWSQSATQFFFSDSVDMTSFVYQPIYESPPYNLLALK